MREIKFRAWDKNDEVMRDWKDVILTKDKGDAFYMLGYEENKVITSFDHNQILLQYTGLKDKNGVEIYEGDIVKGTQYITTSQSVPSETLGKVRYSKVSAMFCLDRPSVTPEFTFSLGNEIYTLEVIGNIYENPELLETKKSS